MKIDCLLGKRIVVSQHTFKCIIFFYLWFWKCIVFPCQSFRVQVKSQVIDVKVKVCYLSPSCFQVMWLESTKLMWALDFNNISCTVGTYSLACTSFWEVTPTNMVPWLRVPNHSCRGGHCQCISPSFMSAEDTMASQANSELWAGLIAEFCVMMRGDNTY